MERSAHPWVRLLTPGDLLDWPLGVLGFLFLGITAAVYMDQPEGDTPTRLQGIALEGRKLWNAHNCQACHQLHGFGGFLGPDLTNITSRRRPEEIRTVLENGRGKMPDLDIGPAEGEALLSFLHAMNATGASRPRLVPMKEPERTVSFGLLAMGTPADGRARVIGLPAVPGEPRHGEDVLVRNGCAACHVPFRSGRMGAPDLTLAWYRVGEDGIRRRLAEGRGAMPPFAHLPDADVEAIVGYLRWIGENRAEIGRRWIGEEVEFRWTEVPWFEYGQAGAL